MAPSLLTTGEALLASQFYPKECLEAAADAFRDRLTIRYHPVGDTPAVRIEIECIDSSDPLQMRREFLNYLLDLSVQHRLVP